ncbi:MAG: hypothetical protein IKG18_11775 [Atopobiaceae bacterium]|nr:hypothetical protein [Atopobiaceae bacterium]MBR3314804.1 hypothetical protein [Atopobiaceae bacterium]
MATPEERAAARTRLVRAAEQIGLPAEFGALMCDQLRSAVAMNRMSTYLLGVRPTRMEDIADEMLALMQLRDSWVEQKRSEEANAAITAFYNRPRE